MPKWVVRRGLVQGQGDYYHFRDDNEDKNGWDPDPKTADVFDTWAEAQEQVCASGTSCYATNESFARQVQMALDAGINIQALADEYQCAVSTVRRWGAGTANPHPKLQEMVLVSITKLGFGACSPTRRQAIEDCVKVCQDVAEASSSADYHPERKLGAMSVVGKLRELLWREGASPFRRGV